MFHRQLHAVRVAGVVPCRGDEVIDLIRGDQEPALAPKLPPHPVRTVQTSVCRMYATLRPTEATRTLTLRSVVRIELAGRVAIADGGRVLEEAALPGRQGRLVLARLALADGPIHRDLLAEALWPDGLPATWERTLSGVISRLRSALISAGFAEASIANAFGCYELQLPPAARVDVREAAHDAAAAEAALADGDLTRARNLAQQAGAVARRPLLSGDDADWLEAERATLRDVLVRALETQAAATLGSTSAVESASEAVEIAPLRESAYALLMRAHAAFGNVAEALVVYERCRALIADELGIDPSPELQTLQLELLRTFASEDATYARVPFPPGLRSRKDLTFVGRRDELEALRAAYEDAADRVRIALISGEPGAGKTRLAAEFAASAFEQGATVLFGRCDEALAVPFQPFVEALTFFCDYSAPDAVASLSPELVVLVPELREHLSGEPLSADPETEKYRLFESVTAWLTSASAERPVVFVIDDLHWATQPTLLLLRHIVRSAALMNVLIVATYRDTEAGELSTIFADLSREGASTVTLTGLRVEDVSRLVDDADLAAEIHEASAGNPFFVGELIRHHAASGDTAIPRRIQHVVAQRLAQLSPPTREALRLAAVAGEQFEANVIGCLVRDVDVAMREALAAKLVSEVPGPGLRYRFAHAIVRSTIDEDLTASERARLHQNIGEAIESLGPQRVEAQLAQLAEHFDRAAALVGPEKAIDYLARAGTRALHSHANADAASMFTRVLDLLPRDDVVRRIDVLTLLGDALWRDGSQEAARTILDAVALAETVRDGDRMARAVLAINRGFPQIGRIDVDLIDALDRTLRVLPDEDNATRARLMAVLAMELTHHRDAERRHELSERALAMARRLGDTPTLVHVLRVRHDTIWAPDTLDERIGYVRELTEIAERTGDVIARYWAACLGYYVHMQAGNGDDAYQATLDLQSVAEILGTDVYRWTAFVMLTGAEIGRGRFKHAEHAAEQAFIAGQAAGQFDSFNHYGAHVFAIRHDQGRLAEVTTLIEQAAADELSREGAATVVTIVRGMLAVAYAETGRDEEAREVLRPLAVDGFRAVPRNSLWLSAMMLFAAAASRARDTTAAQALFDLMKPYAHHIDSSMARGSASHWLAVLAATLGLDAEAHQYFRTAESFHEKVGAPGWLARTRADWASFVSAVDRRRARELARQALDVAEEIGMSAVAQQAQLVLG